MQTPEFLNRPLTEEQQLTLAKLKSGAESMDWKQAPEASCDVDHAVPGLANRDEIDNNRAEVLQHLADLIIDSYLEWKRQ